MITVNFAELKAALMCQAVNDVRYYLNAVYFDPDGHIVATDGYRLFCGSAKVPKDESALVAFKGKVPTTFKYCTIENTVAIFYDKKGDAIAWVPTETIDGRFPDWRRVTSFTAGKVDAVGIHAAYLADACKIAKLFDSKFESLKLEFQDASSAVRISFKDGAFKFIMPMRIK